MSEKTNYKQALGTLVTVFFFWGFIAESNGVFIPFCKTYFQIDQFQSQLVDFAFYGAYYFGALILFVLSYSSGTDIMNKWGYKNSIIYGLLLSFLGAIAMYPAVQGANPNDSNAFYYVLGSLFIVGLGFSLQQIAANPFAISLGEAEKGAHRLNLAGGINSLGTTIGPIVVALILFGSTPKSRKSIKVVHKQPTLVLPFLGHRVRKGRAKAKAQNTKKEKESLQPCATRSLPLKSTMRKDEASIDTFSRRP